MPLQPNANTLSHTLPTQAAGTQLALIDPPTGAIQPLATPFTTIGTLTSTQVNGKTVITTSGSAPTVPSQLVYVEVGSSEELPAAVKDGWTVIARSTDLDVDPGYISVPQSIEFPTEGGKTAYMIYYPVCGVCVCVVCVWCVGGWGGLT